MENNDFETNFVLKLHFETLADLEEFRSKKLLPQKEKRGSATARRHSATREFHYNNPEFTYKECYKIICDSIKLNNIAIL